MSENVADLKKRQIALYEMFEEVAEKFGKWDKGVKADGAHYMEKHPFVKEGLVCSNCSFFQGGRACEIVSGDIDPNAICKLWVIKDKLVKGS